MAATIYKKGQGYWTRLMSAIGFGMLILMGVYWVWELLEGTKIGNLEAVYVQGGIAVILLAGFGIVGYWLIGRHRRVVDFMVATEGEMKKVNWSSRQEILSSTWVVIALTIFIAIFCFIADRLFQLLFSWMEVLKAI